MRMRLTDFYDSVIDPIAEPKSDVYLSLSKIIVDNQYLSVTLAMVDRGPQQCGHCRCCSSTVASIDTKHHVKVPRSIGIVFPDHLTASGG